MLFLWLQPKCHFLMEVIPCPLTGPGTLVTGSHAFGGFLPGPQHVWRMIWATPHCLPSLPGRELSEGRALSTLFTVIFPLRGTEPAPGRSTAASAGRGIHGYFQTPAGLVLDYRTRRSHRLKTSGLLSHSGCAFSI